MNKPKAVLVTGCAGFIGSNFVKQFLVKFPSTQVVGVDDFSTGRRDAVSSTVVFYKGSILDEKLIKKIFSAHKIEYVFHFAALPRVSYSVEHPRETSEVNIIGTIALLEASRDNKVKRFIYSSSSSVYGGAKKLPTKESENLPDPKSPYAIQKYIGEPFCQIFSSLYNLDTVCLRYFNVFGPGQYGDSPYSTVISAWLESLYFPKKKKGFIEGSGTQSRDFCYIDNVVLANILAMESKKKLNGEVFNVGYSDMIKISFVKSLIEKYTGRKLVLEKRPSRIGDVKNTCADISKSKKILGYVPIVDFEEGLRRTIAWFDERVK
ncbi:MAG: LPS biosynthesis protein WbpP [Candidatus Harrisonbacteria bacterium CG10_big_fil_rev_8_21_14_0_10_38_8]|uniref:LPS biosynthesis protein WbpP n=1 Tax=Candidatus Harrisonbacteria bacterium CG10_big_fil_rev_8_21_14_0_10_38_8 TaxID=1974582 RepID=A0A2M6WKW0_9BACT|nr:MAG: LPS biosynthesis protein WbpP [Candidatus Harrisonbacteria bacterium CG10_big_fil_rev_8_21_14_0_10_38_8]